MRLVCLDVDGTLLGPDGVVRDVVWQAVAEARAAGLTLALCSGRPGFGVTLDLARRLNPEGWHCFQNGASVRHLGDGRSLSTPLPDATVALLVARARERDRLLELYTDEEYVTEHESDDARVHAEMLGLEFTPRPFETLAPPIVRAEWIVPHAELPDLLAEPHPGLEVSPSLGPLLPHLVFVNLTRTGIDKGSAVRAIANASGVQLSEVMYVGDGLNDTPALRIAGWPVAVANAEPEARALARDVVASVEEDGVVQALQLAMGARKQR